MKKLFCDNCNKELDENNHLTVTQDMKVIEPGKTIDHGVYIGYDFCDEICLVSRLANYYQVPLTVSGV